jgi:hypothetical protein
MGNISIKKKKQEKEPVQVPVKMSEIKQETEIKREAKSESESEPVRKKQPRILRKDTQVNGLNNLNRIPKSSTTDGLNNLANDIFLTTTIFGTINTDNHTSNHTSHSGFDSGSHCHTSFDAGSSFSGGDGGSMSF